MKAETGSLGTTTTHIYIYICTSTDHGLSVVTRHSKLNFMHLKKFNKVSYTIYNFNYMIF
jgi:hypothetical protein